MDGKIGLVIWPSLKKPNAVLIVEVLAAATPSNYKVKDVGAIYGQTRDHSYTISSKYLYYPIAKDRVKKKLIGDIFA